MCWQELPSKKGAKDLSLKAVSEYFWWVYFFQNEGSIYQWILHPPSPLDDDPTFRKLANADPSDSGLGSLDARSIDTGETTVTQHGHYHSGKGAINVRAHKLIVGEQGEESDNTMHGLHSTTLAQTDQKEKTATQIDFTTLSLTHRRK